MSDVYPGNKIDWDSLIPIVILCGPSGAGKTTLMEMLLKEYPKKFEYVVGYTTRKPRKDEKEGYPYHFITKKKHKEMKDNGELLLSPIINGEGYGTALKDIEEIYKKHKIPIMILIIGDILIIRKNPKFFIICLLIKTPTMEELKKRLKNRGEDDDSISRRMKSAKKRIIKARKYVGLFNKVLINDMFDQCYDDLKNIVMINTKYYFQSKIM